MGQTLSTPERILKLAKNGDYGELKDLLAGVQRHEPDYQRQRARYLEIQREDGSTPLIVAAERGHYQVVELLLQQGANIHHMNRKGEGGSALHVAVAHKHESVVDLLLRSGANPLVENMKGFTAMDIACADKNVTLLRRTEHAAVFKGWLMMKVQRFGGLGSEWQRRWCVICHRYPYPGAPAARQVTHLVFLAYKSTSSTVPSCRVWLDGARAAEVYNPKAIARIHAQGPAQLGITLHRKHDAPTGAFYTGGIGEGFMIYLRPDDGSAQSVASLALFGELVNNKGVRRSQPPSATAATAAQYSQPSTPTYAGIAASTPSAAGAPAPTGWQQFQPLGQAPPALGAVDEEYARRLQMQYDAELAGHMQNNPSPPQASNPPAYPTIAGGSGPQQPQQQSQSGSPMYPSPYPSVYGGAATIPSYAGAQAAQQQGQRPSNSAYPSQPPPPAGIPSYPSSTVSSETSQVQPSYPQPPQPGVQRSDSSAPSAPPLISFDTEPASTAPPQPWWQDEPGAGGSRPVTSFSGPTSSPPSATAAGGGGGRLGMADESDVCVICMDEDSGPPTAGFLHGDSVHRCLCKSCAENLKREQVKTCAMCRQPATIINVF